MIHWGRRPGRGQIGVLISNTGYITSPARSWPVRWWRRARSCGRRTCSRRAGRTAVRAGPCLASKGRQSNHRRRAGRRASSMDCANARQTARRRSPRDGTAPGAPGRRRNLRRRPVWKSKFYGAFVLNHRVVLHAIDATPARWRGDAGSSPLDRARTAASSPRNDLVKNCRVHPTHWLISTQARATRTRKSRCRRRRTRPTATTFRARSRIAGSTCPGRRGRRASTSRGRT